MDKNGMIPLQNHMDFEAMLRPRRPTEEGFDGKYAPWVAVCFSATWCGPCKRLDKASLVKMTPGIRWYAVDIDQNDTTLSYCGLQGVPAFVLLKEGDFIGRKTGAGSVGELLEWLSDLGAPVTH